MIDINKLRGIEEFRVVSLGSHPGIIQSILDYDFLIGRQVPSVRLIVANGRRQERYFWGESEVIIPVISNLDKVDEEEKVKFTGVLNVQSARRVLSSTKQAIEVLPNLQVITIFAEQTPEAHTLELMELAKSRICPARDECAPGVIHFNCNIKNL